MPEHPIQGLMKSAMENLKHMVDVNTILGDPVQTPDGGVILTVSKVGFGYGAGGSDFGPGLVRKGEAGKEVANFPFGGGAAGGVSITPVAFLVVNQDGVNILHLKESTHLMEKVIDLAPKTMEKIKNMVSSDTTQQQQSSGTSDTSKQQQSSGTSDTSKQQQSSGTSDTSKQQQSSGTSGTSKQQQSSGTSEQQQKQKPSNASAEQKKDKNATGK